jgi:excisionase family DNA binding protein
MSWAENDWLSLGEASELVGVHPTTLRRWADSGSITCFRTPGGHRRFQLADLRAWIGGAQTKALVQSAETVVRSAVGFTRQEMARHRVSDERWYRAFGEEEARAQMRDTGRRLFGLAIQYMGRISGREPILREGQRIGEFYGQQCALHSVPLVDTVRALFFFRESLIRAARPGQASDGQYDAEDVRIHRELRYFLDEVMYTCLASYEDTCRHLLHPEVEA